MFPVLVNLSLLVHSIKRRKRELLKKDGFRTAELSLLWNEPRPSLFLSPDFRSGSELALVLSQ